MIYQFLFGLSITSLIELQQEVTLTKLEYILLKLKIYWIVLLPILF